MTFSLLKFFFFLQGFVQERPNAIPINNSEKEKGSSSARRAVYSSERFTQSPIEVIPDSYWSILFPALVRHWEYGIDLPISEARRTSRPRI